MFRLGSRTQFTIGYRDPCRDCENFFPLLPTPYSLFPSWEGLGVGSCSLCCSF
ncbi:MAG: hypothetical protein F6K50_15700 [Moorea sp. SIO3I7]|uniref:hypothetical protein n=1 Tax=unclassified Moorena TaxID=2683338 RepID=UPI0013C14F46|nr:MULTISPECIES: hypothetical protein [unclassified Moorena]NEN96924.1 hypothetical protein [Moorena sp. SIO3I7]NEO08411.1 hypothetical protein [Moorena sp. SIO3I8]NEO17982.1 hypothetical protein [Moorena sp. SIO4A5]NEQ56251.1 hypothetical protein [Moorena sp. SIO4A1]